MLSRRDATCENEIGIHHHDLDGTTTDDAGYGRQRLRPTSKYFPSNIFILFQQHCYLDSTCRHSNTYQQETRALTQTKE